MNMADERIENGQGIAVTVDSVDGGRVLAIQLAADRCQQVAHGLLDEGSWEAAGQLGLMAQFAREFCACARAAIAHPSEQPKRAAPKNVKHVYGSAGLCMVEHDPGHVCGLARVRRPRAGSSADVSPEPGQLDLDAKK
jgi:hypothetical protein